MSWDINFKSPRHPGLKKKAERRKTAEVAQRIQKQMQKVVQKHKKLKADDIRRKQ